MDIKQIEREFAEKIEKALRNNDYKKVDNLMRQFDRIKNTRECVPAKKITDEMTPEDKERCNTLLRVIPVLSDIIEGTGIDLVEMLKKYDGSVSLPMLEIIKRINYLSKKVREIVDNVKSESFAESFGDTCDNLKDVIFDFFEKEQNDTSF